MNATPFDTRSSEWAGDMTVWLRENANDNQEQIERLLRNLRKARIQELTPRQQQMLEMRFEQNMSGAEIARELGLNRSTVSRTLRRAQNRLRRCLQYAL
ncbi:sigma-70 family RNA polymerase sigma factor [Oscillibacter sp.]|uniref:sigma-70 family RNA polymerase sigma factor n=1 Tax=Oscillibacter sp. TaxID=1945593 RepID=UPI001B668A0A|nr:sigma-70 family RNA polymerase sigma factor [Oscillibacter sp.]MBP3509999.1 sigma-70 family RNA polymerase sigma factor [Oscillibacter sp.]